MLNLLKEMLEYPFMARAFTAGTLIALCAALLGVSLVLKRYSMIGDGLSHVGFGSLALATALNAAPMAVAIPIVVIASVFMLWIAQNSRINGDAAIALISTGSMAVGVMIISMTNGMNVDVYNYLFGSILSMSRGDVLLSTALSAIVLLLFILFYNRIFSVTFDESFARAKRHHRPADRARNRSRHAHDGRAADFRADRIPCTHLHAHLQDLPDCNHQLLCHRNSVPLGWSDALLSVRNTKRRKHRRLQHRCILHLRTDRPVRAEKRIGYFVIS